MSNVKIKICGLVREEDVALVNRLCCDFAGFVLFYPKSKRNLNIDQARRLIHQLGGVKAVAVVVSPSPEQIRTISEAGFDFVQIHGELSDESYDACSLPILRAFNVSNMSEYQNCMKLDKIAGYVFDASEPGSGKIFDWNSLSNLPDDGKLRILAGGLDPQNVRAAIVAVKPDAVDVSSGVELPQGGKDPLLTEQFVTAVRKA